MEATIRSRLFVKMLGAVAPSYAARLMVYQTSRPWRQVQPQPETDSVEGDWVTFRFGHKALRWGNSGPIVVAMHGWQGHPDQFRFFGSRLADRGYQFFALNGPGHGEDPNTHAHIGLFADYLQDVAAELGSVNTFIGHSFGGGASLLALSEGLCAERVVAIAAPSGVSRQLKNLARQAGLSVRAEKAFLALIERRVGYALDDLEADKLLSKIDTPLLIVHDQIDQSVPFADAEEIHLAAPAAAILATAGLGHNGVLKSDLVVKRILAFIDKEAHAVEDHEVDHPSSQTALAV